ncbi:MAG TPA: NAD(P)/FAD-dependent oxidoreductase [Gammaproteobacteria bacterium]|nr:NAD(P)/FAD-dependent oxidoreductase [Gammaproteobacteria bacterium]
MTETVDAVVVGAGVVGLAVGRALALDGREVIVLEKNQAIGAETSSRSSEVIHAGIYYTPGSLKAHLCVQGRRLLYAYCREKSIAHRRVGKLIVAVSDHEERKLEALDATARANGVEDLQWLARDAIRALEPAVVGTIALFSPSSGIIDSHALMLALQGDIERAGGVVVLRASMRAARYSRRAIGITIEGEGETTELSARVLVNAAGLHATRVALSIEDAPAGEIPETRYAKGNYFIYSGKSPFRHLLYPLPQDGGLGVHATLDLEGRTRFGPDVEWSDTIDYSLDAARADAFYDAVRRYWPDLPAGALRPGYVGVRPKLAGPGEPPADFRIEALGDPDAARIVHLFGIESPGLTASLALGEHVRRKLIEAEST